MCKYDCNLLEDAESEFRTRFAKSMTKRESKSILASATKQEVCRATTTHIQPDCGKIHRNISFFKGSVPLKKLVQDSLDTDRGNSSFNSQSALSQIDQDPDEDLSSKGSKTSIKRPDQPPVLAKNSKWRVLRDHTMKKNKSSPPSAVFSSEFQKQRLSMGAD